MIGWLLYLALIASFLSAVQGSPASGLLFLTLLLLVAPAWLAAKIISGE